MFTRGLESVLRDALRRSPSVLVSGPRQSGKSTLVRKMAGAGRTYVSFDDPEPLAAASANPREFLAGFADPVILDEVQKVPALFPALKVSIDRDRRPGRFVLTGSANVLLVPRVSESLAGRIELLTLSPLSQLEIEGRTSPVIDRWFEGNPDRPVPISRADLVGRILRGGFPEPATRGSHADRKAWFSSYLATVLTRDVRDLADIDLSIDLRRLVALVAARSAAPLNYSELSDTAGMPQTSLKRYLGLLNTLYLAHFVPAWATSPAKSLARRPKLLLADSGLMAHLLSLDAARLAAAPTLLGPLLETFALNELARQCDWSPLRPRLLHFRDAAGREVDAVLEDGSGHVVGIEVKAGQATLGPDDLRGMKELAAAAKKKFLRGIVLYGGDQVVPFAANIHAVPISALWT